MPTYEYKCLDCAHEFEEMRDISQRNDPCMCPLCGSKDTSRELRTAPGMRGDVFDWSGENGGRGRLISQLQHKVGPVPDFAYCKNRQEIFDKCAKKGWGVEKVY